jgi:hypothetical protein
MAEYSLGNRLKRFLLSILIRACSEGLPLVSSNASSELTRSAKRLLRCRLTAWVCESVTHPIVPISRPIRSPGCTGASCSHSEAVWGPWTGRALP